MAGSLFLPTPSSLLTGPGKPYIHRDLSWLQFNERVLKEARTSDNPLLERAKFLAITVTNLDEFFMVRFASLGHSLHQANRASGQGGDARKRRALLRTRNSILETVSTFTARQAETLDILSSELDAHGVHIIRQPREDEPAFRIGRAVFEEQVLPNLAPPEAVTLNGISQLENLQMAAIFGGDLWFRIPKSLPQVFLTKPQLQDKGESEQEHFVFFLDDLLTSHLAQAFRITAPFGLIRVTRDGDFSVDLEEEDTASIPDIVRSNLGSRERGRFVRVQFAGNVPDIWLDKILKTVRLSPGQLQAMPTSLCLGGLWTVVNQLPDDKKNLAGMSLKPMQALVPPMLQRRGGGDSIFDELKKRDILLHHPYDSFEGYVNFIRAACEDPLVTMIQQTVYRMDTLSPVVDALKKAACDPDRPKKIRVVIELRARFDELNNLRLADDLRKSGIEVAFGFGKLKLHAKVALVTRQEALGEGDFVGVPRHYTHLSTGNYNAATARQYEDLAILTANAELGEDANWFFDSVCSGKVPTTFKKLVAAPMRLHRRLLNLIESETLAAKNGQKARIVAKVNALVDNAVIDKLYLASQAGVQVDLIVRGACSLIPGVKSLSENIRVISVVDRFLEHSRIYYFGHSNAMYLSSADWMPRNFFSRLELAFPVLDPDLFQFIEKVIIPAYLLDTVRGRELTPQGAWKTRTPAGIGARYRKLAQELSPLFEGATPVDKAGAKPAGKNTQRSALPLIRAQFFFEELAAREYRGTPLNPESAQSPARAP